MHGEIFPDVFTATDINPPAGKRECILVIDDDECILMNVKRILEMSNYRVLPASSGAAGLKLYLRFKDEVSLVITDIVIPDLQGPTIILLLRMISAPVRIIAMSGYAPTCPEIESLHADEENFLGKPFTTAELLCMVREVIDRKT